MPYSFRFTDDGRGIVHTGSGTVTGDDIVACHLARNREGPRLTGQEYGLTDFHQVTTLSLTMQDIQNIVAVDHAAVPLVGRAISVAIVAPSDLSYGMSRMWEALVEQFGWATHVFRTRAEAVAWLRERHPGIDPGVE